VSVLGLAVPVTASFVISWVIIGPALQDLGVAAPAVAMFVFYFAVLSEVTPPTALASVAASAITGGRVIPTMWQTWKYTLPAFLVPFAFVLTDNGEGLLGLRSFGDMVWTGAVGALAVAALAVVTGGWLIRRAGWPERVLCAAAAALLLYLHPITMAVGAGLLALALAVHLVFAADPQWNHPPLRGRCGPKQSLAQLDQKHPPYRGNREATNRRRSHTIGHTTSGRGHVDAETTGGRVMDWDYLAAPQKELIQRHRLGLLGPIEFSAMPHPGWNLWSQVSTLR
jgi:hypothetical protein